MNMIEISFREVPPILFFDETPYCFIIFNSGEIVFSKDYHGVIIKSRSNAEPITWGQTQTSTSKDALFCHRGILT